MFHHLMLIPSLTCPAQCGYCFGPKQNSPPMTLELLDTALNWAGEIRACKEGNKFEVVFHGGEPLAAGADFFRTALSRLRKAFGKERLQMGIQSNLWLLRDELCDLFTEFGVSLGTSLDGPEEINDAQRGQGYFRRTMQGIERARRHGLSVGCICTFTAKSALRYLEVFDFFVREGLGFSVHASVLPLLHNPKEEEADHASRHWLLSPQAYSDLLVNMLDHYLPNLNKMRISTLDSLCRSVSAGEGGICTFRDCLGDYLAVAPDGGIYPCQRFAGHAAFCLGNVQDQPALEKLEQTPAWQLLREREERVAEACGDCPHFAFCKGGCPYDALAAGSGVFRSLRDPYCLAYKRIFSYITDRALSEVFSEENLREVVAEPGAGTLLRRGKILTLMRGGPHPTEVAKRARELVSAVALAACATPEEAVAKLDRARLITNQERAIESLTELRRQLDTGREGLLNLYLHVTYGCNLKCTHCYAQSGPSRVKTGATMSVNDVISLIREASALNFRKVVITGGEPLVHPQCEALLRGLADLREAIKPIQTVLRTNLAYPLPPVLLQRIAHSTDQVVVSVDGCRSTHDRRRGSGSYDRMAANLRALIATNPSAEISLVAVLAAEQTAGEDGKAVRTLAEEFGGLHVRFKPLLPLGRARQSGETTKPDVYWKTLKKGEAMAYGFRPVVTCGVGCSLYVAPDGETYPCYALVGDAYALGNVLKPNGLKTVVESDQYRALAEHTVDTNRKCMSCPLRYLCGGACRAWTNILISSRSDEDVGSLDDPPEDCQSLYTRARSLLESALDVLNVSRYRWSEAGLPLPNLNDHAEN